MLGGMSFGAIVGILYLALTAVTVGELTQMDGNVYLGLVFGGGLIGAIFLGDHNI